MPGRKTPDLAARPVGVSTQTPIRQKSGAVACRWIRPVACWRPSRKVPSRSGSWPTPGWNATRNFNRRKERRLDDHVGHRDDLASPCGIDSILPHCGIPQG